MDNLKALLDRIDTLGSSGTNGQVVEELKTLAANVRKEFLDDESEEKEEEEKK